MRSVKQQNWSKRAWLLMRLKGTYFNINDNIVTEKERHLIELLNEIKTLLIQDFSQNSQKLGFKVKK